MLAMYQPKWQPKHLKLNGPDFLKETKAICNKRHITLRIAQSRRFLGIQINISEAQRVL